MINFQSILFGISTFQLLNMNEVIHAPFTSRLHLCSFQNSWSLRFGATWFFSISAVLFMPLVLSYVVFKMFLL